MVGTPATNRRPDSTNTNKSDLLNEPISEIDNQSVRTMIVKIFKKFINFFKEVNPNGYMVNPGNAVEFFDSNCIVDYGDSRKPKFIFF